jgi:hypothetical protein
MVELIPLQDLAGTHRLFASIIAFISSIIFLNSEISFEEINKKLGEAMSLGMTKKTKNA